MWKYFLIIFVFGIVSCDSEQDSSIRRGTYVRSRSKEKIIVLDSERYVHIYLSNWKEVRDTSIYDFHIGDSHLDGWSELRLHNFNTNASFDNYYDGCRVSDGDGTMVTSLFYHASRGQNGTPVIVSDIDRISEGYSFKKN